MLVFTGLGGLENVAMAGLFKPLAWVRHEAESGV